MREIIIDFSTRVPQVSSGIWGFVGEHNVTQLKCTLSKAFDESDYVNAEFELKDGKKVVVEKLDKADNTLLVPVTQQVSLSYRVAVQIIGYKVNDETGDINEIAKTEKVYGMFGESVMGTQVETDANPGFAERAFVKAEEAFDAAKHNNRKTLDSLYREDLENKFILNHLGAHYLSCGGGYLRFCSDGSVIRRTELVEENGKNYLRLWLDHGPLSFNQVTDFIDVPIANSEEKTGADNMGVVANGTSLDLGFSDLEEKVNELINADAHTHTNLGTLRALSCEKYDGGIILGYPSETLKFDGKDIRFCNDGKVIGTVSTVVENGRKYQRVNVIYGKTLMDVTGYGPSETEVLADTLLIPIDTVSIAEFNAAINAINNHTHENMNVLNYLNENVVRYWDSIDNHSHSNKTVLDTIKGIDVVNWQAMVVKVNSSDNGKVMQVVNGVWKAVALEFAAIYVGSSAPTNDIGVDGDIYIQTE